MMLKIKNLHVKTNNKKILNGINLNVKKGEIHAIMGPNGSGKSTLGHAISGNNKYVITDGNIYMNKKSILPFTISERASMGLFFGFQHPVEIPGVTNAQFLQVSLNSIRKFRGQKEIDQIKFIKNLKKNMKILKIKKDYMNRYVNDNFSGGEKKQNEILQMMMLNPKISILDEIDSGLDIDALKTISQGIKHSFSQKSSIIIITHYKRILDYINPDFVHILYKGKIIKSGDKKLAVTLEKKGYSWI